MSPPQKGRLIIISAPSGTGKTSVIQHFLAAHPNMIHSVSCTTRPIRKGEKEGVDYHFITREKFQGMIEKNEFAEWAEVHDHRYGTPKAPLERALKEEREILLDLDVQGGMALKKMFELKALSIFLLPPSLEELERRLSQRGTDSSKQLAIRMRNARQEMAVKDSYDIQIINENLSQACLEIEKVLKSK